MLYYTYPFFLAAPGAISTLNITNILATDRTKRRATSRARSARPGIVSFCCSRTKVCSSVSNICNFSTHKQLSVIKQIRNILLLGMCEY